jgi:ABC-type branched-subunit amino acid transport system substrate-binding protein
MNRRWIIAVCGLTLASGCGTQVSRDAVLRAEAGGAVAGTPATGGQSTVDTGASTATLPSGASAPAAAASTPGAAAGPASGSARQTSGAASSGATAVGAQTGTATVAAGCAKQGPPVVLGQVGGFSGIVGANVQGAIAASYVWVKDVNARGGLGCHPVTFIQKDDGSNPAQAQATVQDLVENHGAIGLFSNWDPLGPSGFRAGVEKEGIPAVGGDQNNPDWNQSPLLFAVGGTYRPQFAGALKAVADAGGRKVAVLYCVEATGCTAFYNTVVKDGYAKKFGMAIVYTATVSATQTDFTSECQNAKNAGADTVVFAGDASGIERVARSCSNLNYFPKMPIAAIQASFNRADPNLRKDGVYLGSDVFPFTDADNPAEADFQAAMKKYAPSAPIDGPAATTWASGKMLELVVSRLGPSAQGVPLTKEMLLQGLATVKNETLNGLIPPTTYPATGQTHFENLCYYGLKFNPDGTMTAIAGSNYQCIPPAS